MKITDNSVLEFLAKFTKISKAEILANLTKKGENDVPEILPESEVIAYLEGITQAKVNAVGSTNLGRGKAEALTAAEKEQREKYGLTDTSLKGIALIEAIVSSEVAKAKPTVVQGDKLTLETAKASPIVQQLLQDAIKPVLTEKETIQKSFQDYMKEAETKELKNKIWNTAKATFRKNKHLLGKDGSTELENQKDFFLRGLDLSKYKLDTTDPKNAKVLILDKDGNPERDKYQGLITPESHFVTISPFPVVEHDPNQGGSGAGSGGSGSGGSGAASGRFKTEEELMSFINNPDKTVEEKQKAYDDFNKNKKEDA